MDARDIFVETKSPFLHLAESRDSKISCKVIHAQMDFSQEREGIVTKQERGKF